MRGYLRLMLLLVTGLGVACSDHRTAAAPSPPPSPAAAAKAFYTAYRALPVGGGIPTAETRASLEPLITPALAKLLADADAAEAAYAVATKRKSPPLVEGDPFTSLFEGASSFAVGECSGDGAMQRCPVALTYNDPRGQPVKWTDTADMALTNAGWRLDDIEYGGTWQFGNKGKLTDLLREVITEGKAPGGRPL